MGMGMGMGIGLGRWAWALRAGRPLCVLAAENVLRVFASRKSHKQNFSSCLGAGRWAMGMGAGHGRWAWARALRTKKKIFA
jgi:hypothetical protein